MDDDAEAASEHDDVKERLLIEGLQDWVDLAEVHSRFLFEGHTPKRGVNDAQRLTLSMIRELVAEGLFIPGEPDKKEPSGFKPSDTPLDELMAEVEKAYVHNFDNRESWLFCLRLALTEKGKTRALQLYHADEL
jgi:hypothetical protein